MPKALPRAKAEVLASADLMNAILARVDESHHFYFAMVNKEFRERFRAKRPQRTRQQRDDPPFWTRAATEAGGKAFLGWGMHMMASASPQRKRLVPAALANSGRLDLLKHARALRVPWDKNTCFYAAVGGRLDVLVWARQNGCPWDGWVVQMARALGHHEVADWASANGCYSYSLSHQP